MKTKLCRQPCTCVHEASIWRLRKQRWGMRWCARWRSPVMQKPSLLYFRTKTEAESFRTRFIAAPPPHQLPLEENRG